MWVPILIKLLFALFYNSSEKFHENIIRYKLKLGRCDFVALKKGCMTPEQKKNAERLRRYIEREQLYPVMNNTKWREAIDALVSIKGFAIHFRVKCLRGAEPSMDYWGGSFPEHIPYPYKVIEWLDIDPLMKLHRGQLVAPEIRDFTEEVQQALSSKNVPFVQMGDVIRIYGYTRIRS